MGKLDFNMTSEQGLIEMHKPEVIVEEDLPTKIRQRQTNQTTGSEMTTKSDS